MIDIRHLTRDYGGGRGVFDLSLSVGKGETVGFLGPNGAGKTTALRHLMGFLRPQEGQCTIDSLDCFRQAPAVQKKLGYLPGEIAFPEDMTGTQLLRYIAGLKGVSDHSRTRELLERFSFNPEGKVRRMSKGQKQKLGIAAAFMADPEILLLDEPTSGLDPVMQDRFVRLIQEEKARGKTILLSSHLFEEAERTCDRVAIIHNGRLMADEKIEVLRRHHKPVYQLTFADPPSAEAFCRRYPGAVRTGASVRHTLSEPLPDFLRTLVDFPVTDLAQHEQTLEELFRKITGGEDNGLHAV